MKKLFSDRKPLLDAIIDYGHCEMHQRDDPAIESDPRPVQFRHFSQAFWSQKQGVLLVDLGLDTNRDGDYLECLDWWPQDERRLVDLDLLRSRSKADAIRCALRIIDLHREALRKNLVEAHPFITTEEDQDEQQQA